MPQIKSQKPQFKSLLKAVLTKSCYQTEWYLWCPFFLSLLQYLFLPLFCDFLLFALKANRKCEFKAAHLLKTAHAHSFWSLSTPFYLCLPYTFNLSRPKAYFNMHGLHLIQGFLVSVKKVDTKGGTFLPETDLKWMYMNMCNNSDS